MKRLGLFLGIVLMCGTANAASVVLPADRLIQQTEIYVSGTSILSTTVTLTQSSPVLVTSTIRWFMKDPSTAFGDMVGRLRINGMWVGPLLLNDTCKGCPWQSSNTLAYTTDLPQGTHRVELVVGGCCGLYGRPFWVGADSRLDVTPLYSLAGGGGGAGSPGPPGPTGPQGPPGTSGSGQPDARVIRWTMPEGQLRGAALDVWAQSESTLPGSFVEGIRVIGQTNRSSPGCQHPNCPSPYGTVTYAIVETPRWSYAIGHESEVDIRKGETPTTDAFNWGHLSAAYNATGACHGCAGGNTETVDVAFLVNPWSQSGFKRGFLVPAKVTLTGFEDASNSWTPFKVSGGQHGWGLDLSGGLFSEGVIKLPAPGGQDPHALCVSGDGRVYVSPGRSC